jgi:RimJ/RimL family protein N-acetyltransferase
MRRVSDPLVQLRAVRSDDLATMRRLAVEPGLLGLTWSGFSDAGAVDRRFAADGYLGPDGGRLVVEVDDVAAGFVGWHGVAVTSPRYWNIAIVLLPDFRGRGVGWRAQAMLCEYLFEHTPVERVEAGTQPENVAEQRALERAGFTKEGELRRAEFRAGAWRDVWVYSRLRD